MAVNSSVRTHQFTQADSQADGLNFHTRSQFLQHCHKAVQNRGATSMSFGRDNTMSNYTTSRKLDDTDGYLCPANINSDQVLRGTGGRHAFM
jgi:hypothetical protein